MRIPHRVKSSLGTAAALTLLLPMTAAVAAPSDDPIHVAPRDASPAASYTHATTGRWFVEMASEPVVAGGDQHQISSEQDAFVEEAADAGVPAEVTSEFSELFNGVVVEAADTTAAVYEQLPSVVAVYPVFEMDAPEPEDVSPQLTSAVAMTGADIAQSELGFTGEGVKVGIIDTGVDYDHPDLGGTGDDTFPTDRVPYGYDFVGDSFNASSDSPTYDPVPTPDADPDDCHGHGTHVAGIVGASGELTGVAPDVTFGAYRVFGCDGSTTTEVMLAAMERAMDDGMDVINMSIGAAFQGWPDYPTGAAADWLTEAGVVVVASAGNEGDYYTQVSGSPSVGRNVIGVASFDNTTLTQPALVVTDGETELTVGFASASGSPALTSELDGTPITLADPIFACEPIAADLTGQVLLAQRGTCTFHQKAANAQAAGAEAVIIMDNQPGLINMTVEGDPAITIPALSVTQADGEAIVALVADETEPTTLSVPGTDITVENPTGGLVSDFSSWGLAADLSLKPDLGAPGGQIYSTYPLEEGGYVTMSGTSMAAPHVAGAVALMLEAEPQLTPASVLSRLQNTASPAPFSLVPDAGLLDATHHQGAGLIQVDDAIQATTSVAPGKISAGESADGAHTESLTIANTSDAAETYSFSYEPAVGTWVDYEEAGASQNAPGFYLFDANVEFSTESVQVPAGAQSEFQVTVSPADDVPEGATYTGYVIVKNAAGDTVTTIPYAGMAGDYGNLPVLTDPYGIGLPALGVLLSCDTFEENQCVDEDAEFDLARKNQTFHLGTDRPTILSHFDQPALSVTVDVVEARPNGKPVDGGRTYHAFTVDLVGRDASISAWAWDGYVDGADGERVLAEPGTYVMTMTVVKPDGDGGTESYTTQPFHLSASGTAPGQSN